MKKLVSIVLSFCFLLTLSIPTFAAEKTTNTKIVAFQSIMDRINEEYGTDFHFPTKEELTETKLESNPATIAAQSSASPEQLKQFEDQLRTIAISLVKKNVEAEAAWKTAASKGNVVSSLGDTNILTPQLTLVRSLHKDIDGGEAYFEGYVNDGNGYWRWTSFTTTRVTPDVSSSSTRYFSLDHYSYTFIDTGRTCAMNYYGTLYNKTILGWIPSSSTQYVEWWASSTS